MKIFRVLFIVTAILLCVPRIVHADDSAYVCFYNVDEEGEYSDSILNVEFIGEFTLEEKIYILMDMLLNNYEAKESAVPKDTTLLSIDIDENGKLKLNLSEEGFNCAGNSHQQLFVNQIVKTAYSLDEIKGIILFIEGKESSLPEGIDFSYFDR